MIDPKFNTKKNKETKNYCQFVIEPLPFSFGHSMGNALRRTLLSSLSGAAITYVKIKGAPHMFTTIKGIKESMLEIILNLKQLRFKTNGKGPFEMEIDVKGKTKVFSKDLKGEAKVIDKDIFISQLTDEKAHLKIEAIVEVGSGHSLVEERTEKKYGYIPVDAFFSPVKKVNYKVEKSRIGRKTNFDRLIMEVWTDKSITPTKSVQQATLMLADHFNYLLSGKDIPKPKEERSEEEIKKEKEDEKVYNTIIDELNLPSRVINTLLREKIETVGDLTKVGKDNLRKMKGVGKKSVDLIESELSKLNISLE